MARAINPFSAGSFRGLKKSVCHKENMLIHAVTGAGKTEMIYETLASILNQGVRLHLLVLALMSA